MDSIEITYRLRRLGKSQAQIARDLQVSSGVVSNVIHGRITAYAVASYVSGLLDCTVDELWPGQYTFKPRRRAAAAENTKKEEKRVNHPAGGEPS